MAVQDFSPGADSTPEATSTMCAPVMRTASSTLLGVSPPASIHGRGQFWPAMRRQSKVIPLPPGMGECFGALASRSSISALWA